MIAIIKVIRNIVDDVKFIFATIVFKYCVCPPNIIEVRLFRRQVHIVETCTRSLCQPSSWADYNYL